jgi:5'-nucleotidase
VLDWHGVKVGVMGLVEFEWLATLATLNADEVLYVDFVEEARLLCKELKREGCDVIIALTHMRVPNDKMLGAAVPEIDVILGGHDHHYEVIRCEPTDTLLFKSGTDFKDLSLVKMAVSNGNVTVRALSLFLRNGRHAKHCASCVSSSNWCLS